MNGSSALNNVLMAAPVQPKANTLSQKGDVDADSTMDFKRAFDDVRSDQDVKPKEPCAKKLAATDKRSKTKSDDSATTDSAATPTKKPVSQVSEKSTESDKAEDTIASDDSKKTDITDASENVLITAVLDVPVPVEPVAEEVTIAPVATESVDAVQNIEATVLNKEASIVPAGSVVDTSLEGEAVVSTPVASVATEIPQQETNIVSVSEAIANVGDANDVAVASDVAAVTATANAAADEAIADVVTAAAIDTSKSTDVKASGFATETAATSVASDDNPSAATADLKAIFEKMLQAMSAGAGANTNTGENSQGSHEQTSNPIASIASATTSTPSPFDALARSVEAQSPAARGFVVQTSVPVPVGQPQWSQAVGEKVLWLAAQNVHSAEIRLDPPELGPMQVKISINQEQTSVNFTSHHAGVREVLDQNLGRLRDMFNEQGLNLVNVDVSDKSFQRHQGEGGEQQGQGNRSEQDDEETPVAVSAIVQQRLVDHYA